jgi:hypothetical protein
MLICTVCLLSKKVKNIANPITGRVVQWGCEMLRIPHCLDNLLRLRQGEALYYKLEGRGFESQ